MIGRSVPVAAKPSTVRIRSDAPTPQFAPKAMGGLGSFSTMSTIAAEVTPIIVRPAVSKLIVPHQGMSGQGGGLGGGAVFLGRGHRLDPEHVGAAFLQPLGLFVEHLDGDGMGQRAHRLEDLAGRAHRARDDDRAARRIGHSRPRAAAMRFNSRTRPCALCSFRRLALPPKVLVRKMSDPASTAPR